MAGDFERRAIARLVDQADALGAGDQVPEQVREFLCGDGPGNGGAVAWMRANPDYDEITGCCWGEAVKGPEHCLCWVPVYDLDQADPVPPASPDDITVRPRMCGDCAYRPDSPEQADDYLREALMSLPEDGQTFWCHDGIRRPIRWEHPDGRTVAGNSADYQPPMKCGVPFRADGRPAALCAGWAARTRRAGRLGLLEEKEPAR